MGYPHPKAYALLVPQGVGAELQPARRPQGGWETGTRFVSVVLAMLLAVTMLPVAGLSSAFADEPVERPATSGGDVALEGTNGAAGTSQVPVAEMCEDGMHVADGLVYTVADGGLALVGFDGDAAEGMLAVPSVVSVDGKDTSVVAVDIAEGQTADAVAILSLPQGVKDINVASLAPAFPSLASVEVAGASSSLPVAAGAASVRAAYSTSGGMLFRPTSVTVQADDDSIETIECKELLWAPPALVSARIPVECRAVAEGAFADARDLKTIVAFGTMERIADGAFSADQMESAKVVVPQASAAVTDAERVSASMALMGDAGQKERRSAWHEAGWRTDDIVMGKPYGSLTETVAVTDEGKIERDELQLVSYPGAHENAMDLKKPNADGIVEQAESGLAFTVKSDMTASVTWQGDKAATPAHIDIPASVIIDGVTYPVTEIAARAFEGAVFLASVTIIEGVTTIGHDAFKDCTNLADPILPSTLSRMMDAVSTEVSTSSFRESDVASHSVSSQASDGNGLGDAAVIASDSISTYMTGGFRHLDLWPQGGTGRVVVADSDPLLTCKENAGSAYTINYTGTEEIVSWDMVLHAYTARIGVRRADGNFVADLTFNPPAGYQFTGGTLSGNAHQPESVQGAGGYLIMARQEAVGTSPLLTEARLAGTGSKTTVARSDHNHDTLYSKLADFNALKTTVGNKLDSSAISDYNTNAKLDTKFNTKVSTSDFGSISYGGLDATDTSVYPTSYRKGGTPALPTPVKEGFQFTGWSWARGSASGDSSNIATAFAEAGAVTLTANWVEATPEGNCFFAGSPLDSAVSGAQTHVIAVKLTGDASKTALKSVTFVGNDSTDLIADAQEGSVTFALGSTPDNVGSGGTATWGQELSGTIPLGDVVGGKGLYIKITIPDGAVNKDNVVGSFTADEYVASLVRLDYSFA